ncbi:helix-turn-helix domain-containing protein [Streptomyces sp.]|uniref:transcriptional regulator n=1 Tax=Streptomyces sp. TaxID=1931 RepID=UPI002811C4CA|nr:helix-turn-helix domain-containing protein [Streptomyces sp.]
MVGDDFAGLLRELKERSGLSYGALGKRLHMSASTLHRYVSGEVVPVEFAPAERLARLCRATPEELLELHRRWIRADALRGVKEDNRAKGEGKGEDRSVAPADESTSPEPERPSPTAADGSPEAGREPLGAGTKSPGAAGEPSGAEAGPSDSAGGSAGAGVKSPGSAGGSSGAGTESSGAAGEFPGAGAESSVPAHEASAVGTEPPGDAAPGSGGSAEDQVVTVVGEVRGGAPAGGRRPSRRAALYAGTAITLVTAVVLGATLLPDGDAGRDGSPEAAGAAGDAASVSASASPSGTARSASPSASASASPSASASGPGKSGATPGGPGAARDGKGGGSADRDTTGQGVVPVTVQTTPYYWESPCDHSFLVDRSPQNVPEPPPQQDAVGWAAGLDAVSADRQTVALTLQGTGEETVVLRDLHVRVVGKGAPLTWNKYAMGVGCGGQVNTKAFDVSLDLGNPLAEPVNGQRDFPYSVNESDPEVFYVTAHTGGHDVRWYLELDWSSGSRKGTIRIDDHGKPFRTSASGTDYYGYMLGGSSWDHFEGT